MDSQLVSGEKLRPPARPSSDGSTIGLAGPSSVISNPSDRTPRAPRAASTTPTPAPGEIRARGVGALNIVCPWQKTLEVARGVLGDEAGRRNPERDRPMPHRCAGPSMCHSKPHGRSASLLSGSAPKAGRQFDPQCQDPDQKSDHCYRLSLPGPLSFFPTSRRGDAPGSVSALRNGSRGRLDTDAPSGAQSRGPDLSYRLSG